MSKPSEVIDFLAASTLRDIIEAREIECRDRRSLESLKSAILQSGLKAADILDFLTVADLKFIARELDISAIGRRDDLIARISGDGRTATKNSEPDAPKRVETQPTKNTLPIFVDRELKLSVFRIWLEMELNTGAIYEGDIRRGFCPACSRRHAQKWFSYERSERGFYFYYIKEPQIVESLRVGSKFTIHSLTQYAKANATNSVFAEGIEHAEQSADKNAGILLLQGVSDRLLQPAEQPDQRSFWQRMIGVGAVSGGHIVRHIRLGDFTTIPPFFEVKIDSAELLEAYRKGREAWGGGEPLRRRT